MGPNGRIEYAPRKISKERAILIVTQVYIMSQLFKTKPPTGYVPTKPSNIIVCWSWLVHSSKKRSKEVVQVPYYLI